MGNQGMKNWKLIALFAISLMLIAGLLITDTAIARDGSGTASVMWWPTDADGVGSEMDTPRAAIFRGSNRLYEWDTRAVL